jgi:hypothetical protein
MIMPPHEAHASDEYNEEKEKLPAQSKPIKFGQRPLNC